MIIAKLIGGLGNQLFQYALARYLADAHNTELKIDTSAFEEYKLHKYSLWAFNIIENFASKQEIMKMTKYNPGILQKTIAKIVRKKRPFSGYIEEKVFNFDPAILKAPADVLLFGYWQSEKYFKNISDILMKEFMVKFPQQDKDKEIASYILSCNAVSLHIRRTDYVSNIKTNNNHGVCDLSYYNKCIEKIHLLVDNPHFFVFSDDCAWAHDNLKQFEPITIVEHNGPDKNYEDLRLMSQCKHHIIANSSFSWWGAWLNPNSDKFVIAPQKWFNNRKINTSDLIPNSWIKV